MSSTLYLLRQRTEHISPSLFLSSETDRDIILIEEALSVIPSSPKRVVFAAEGMTDRGSHMILTYDDLIDKIFSSDHIVVL
jgi:hypothetical protein